MSNMVLSSHTFLRNPSTCTMIRPDRICAGEETYSSYSFFSWGMKLIGKPIELTFLFMSSSEFDTFDTLFNSDVPLVWDPQNGSGHTYNVQMSNLDGTYVKSLTSTTGIYRKDVKMTLIIMSVAS